MNSELGTAGFADHFSSLAKGYSEYRPRYPDALFSWLASITPGHETAWDCATGNGQAATSLAKYFSQVIATDASADQIASAALDPRVRYQVAPAEASGLPDASIDLVTVAQAAHWFDRPRFYEEVRRVLRKGGIIAIWCYGGAVFGDERIDRALNHFYREVVGPYWPPERRLIEENYETIEFPFPEIPAPVFQMEGAFTLASVAGYLRTWSATSRFVKAHGRDPVLELEAELRPIWNQEEGNAIRRPADWKIFMRVGRMPL